MNYKMMGKFISRILLVEAVFMIPALLISIFNNEIKSVAGFGFSMLITLLLAGILMLFCNHCSKAFYAREGLVCGHQLDCDESFGLSSVFYIG